MDFVINISQEKPLAKRNHWNELIQFRNNCRSAELSSYAEMLLGQLNTAGGMLIHREIESFLDSHA